MSRLLCYKVNPNDPIYTRDKKKNGYGVKSGKNKIDLNINDNILHNNNKCSYLRDISILQYLQ